MAALSKSLRVRFKHRVKRGKGCWLWIGNKNQRGYGQLREGKVGYSWTAHRLSWMIYRGPILEGLCVPRTCDNPSCVNPKHLWLGTHKDNMRDCIAKGRRAKSYHPHARVRKLTDRQAGEIRGDKRKLRHVARDYGVSISNVSFIRRGPRKSLAPNRISLK